MGHRQRHAIHLHGTRLVALGFSILALGTAVAQETPTGTYSETVEVELISIEARVVDKQGLPVEGLSAGDFQILHDGQPVEVSNFTEFRDGSAVGSSSTRKLGRAAATHHHLIVYIDDLHLAGTHRQALVQALKGFIADQGITAERIMILRQARELNIMAPFGSSQKSLENALESLEDSASGLGREASIQQALDEIQRAWNQSRDATSSGERGPSRYPGAEVPGSVAPGTGGTSPRDVTGSSAGFGGGLVPQSCKIFESRVEAILSGWMQQRSRDIAFTLASLGDSATYLAGLHGTKSLLYLSDALETMPGLELSNFVDTICPGGQQNLTMKALGKELEQAFLNLARHAAANRVTIYSLQGSAVGTSRASGARDSGIRSGSVAAFEASRRASNASGLALLADQTGGQAILEATDFSGSLRELGTEMVHYYSLAYRPPPGSTAREHAVELRMRDSSQEARYRRGYLEKSPDQKFSEKLQGALYLGLVDNPLQARLAADDFRAGSAGNTVMPLRVVLPVELVSFVPEGDHLMGSVLVRILSREIATGATSRADRSFEVKHDPTSTGEWMQLPVELELAPGSHVVAIGILDQESEMTSLVSTTIEVPAT